MAEKKEDGRPDPKPRKHIHLWQAYLWWNTMVELRKRYTLRISAINKGKSHMDAIYEKDMAEGIGYAVLEEEGTPVEVLRRVEKKGKAKGTYPYLDTCIRICERDMRVQGMSVGPIWKWVTSHRGLGGGKESGSSLAAQLMAQIDDIQKFKSSAALRRFAGMAVIDGKAEKNQKGEVSHFNRKLKAICFNIAQQFIYQQTPIYVDIYYDEKARLRELHPDCLCMDCGLVCEKVMVKRDGKMVETWRCPENGKHKTIYSGGHLHTMAWRKMMKHFLDDLYTEWRRSDSSLEATAQQELIVEIPAYAKVAGLFQGSF